DRAQTHDTAYLERTFECATRHDHKDEPITQRQFYQLSAFYNNIDEHGLYSHCTETAPTPVLLLYEGDQETRHRDLLARIAAKEAELARVREQARARSLHPVSTSEGERGKGEGVAAIEPAAPKPS